MKKRLFCFDLDDTLVDEDYWFRERWIQTFKVHDYIFNKKIVNDFFQIYELKGPYYKFHLQDLSLLHNEIDIFQDQIIKTFKSIEISEVLFPGVMHTLKSLSVVPEYSFAIVSNGSYKVVMKRLKALKIEDFFETIICDSYMKKPNTKSFLTISKKYEDHKLIFIGNDVQLDIIPARENGFETFLYVMDKNNIDSVYNPFFDYLSFPNQFLKQ
jgi:HAD superfamily hydrolase (TIGR01549 family)